MDEAALLPGANQSGVRELLEMEGQRRGRHTEQLRDASRRQSVRALFDEQPEQCESRLLRESSERSNCGI
jgi:hypothetical protein